MSPDDVHRLFAQMQYEQDDRNPADHLRNGKFFEGWEDAAARSQEYTAETLRWLTWQNLGYRFGKLLGNRSADQIEDVYQLLAQSYSGLMEQPNTTLHDQDVGQTGPEPSYDWQVEVHQWCQSHQELPDEWEPSVVELFRRAFENTQLPQHAWFGTHRSVASLVVGGIFLTAIYRKEQEWRVSILVDQEPPAIEGVKYESAKSTNGSPQPLLWADTASLAGLQGLLKSVRFWDSFASATHKIHSSSRIANDRDEVQERRKKHRLSDFWNPRAHALGASEAQGTNASEKAGYRHEDVDRRRLIERQIRERRGQQQFREALRERYGDRCLVTGCEVLAVLEAAHIMPYRGENDNHAENGLLLRSDIHTLFDLDLLGIEPEGLRVEIHPSVAQEYARFAGFVLACLSTGRPSPKALRLRYQQFRQRLGADNG